MKSLLVIARHPRFSPQAEYKDTLIRTAVEQNLRGVFSVQTVREELLTAEMLTQANLVGVLSMGRLQSTLSLLERAEQGGLIVINRPSAVRLCGNRNQLYRQMVLAGMQVPPATDATPCWLKRTDGWSEQQGDVSYCANAAELDCAKQRLAQRGINESIAQKHIEGHHLKFYGVGDTIIYPEDFHLPPIQKHLGLDIYGGDAIVDEHGQVYIIDLNDFPSFAVCREEAARAIAQHIINKIQNQP